MIASEVQASYEAKRGKIGVAECPRERVSLRERDTERTDLPMLFNSTLPLRFWSKVLALPSGCWEWQGWRTEDGYGRYWYKGTMRPAHRVAYFALVGWFPSPLSIDHLCRNTSCVNPRHLEPTPLGLNVLRSDCVGAVNKRKSECKNGHPFDLFNTIIRKGGHRGCRICRTRQQAEWYERKKLAGT